MKKCSLKLTSHFDSPGHYEFIDTKHALVLFYPPGVAPSSRRLHLPGVCTLTVQVKGRDDAYSVRGALCLISQSRDAGKMETPGAAIKGAVAAAEQINVEHLWGTMNGAEHRIWSTSMGHNERQSATTRRNRRKTVATCVNTSVKKEVGDITILINNAGIVTGKKFIDSPDALVEKTMQVNTMAHFWTYKAFLPAMMASNHGHLVSIASSAGLIGVNGLADYCASKFAAIGFAESVGLEMLALGKTGVKTTIVCPYFINTGMFDGCSSKWPRFMPILEPEYATKKIVDAILKEQVYLVMPRGLYLIFALKNYIDLI
ncbi:unnamed protein product [Ranitomeya imitator]|uniref:Uncharacterized protein n=1 Tax=Ranitomeya imitator TaxID=111125 RepID=A0ABN9KTA6_9NEOB|nr:unnamed protein product [Ranitomeya imitator]